MIDGVKQMMTQKGTNLRRAYTPMTQYYRSRASFAGTVNRKHFLKDLTGNRRFLCFEALNFNLQHNIPHDKLFSQAVYLFKHGFQYWFDQDEIAELDIMNAEFRDISVEEEAFVNHFKIGNSQDENTQFLTTTQIHQQLVLKTGHKSLSIYQLGRVLRELKVPRPKRNGVYGYLVKSK